MVDTCPRVGTTIESHVVFTPVGSTTPTDPSSVMLTVRDPTGAVNTYTFGVGSTVERLSAGTYRALIVPAVKGRWWFVWKAASPLPGVNATGQDTINVDGVAA